MEKEFPISFRLADGTHVLVRSSDEGYEFHLTRLNSERHNFSWNPDTGAITEAYETRFDRWQLEAVRLFQERGPLRGTDEQGTRNFE